MTIIREEVGTKTARYYLATLRGRIAYLDAKIERKEKAGQPAGYEKEERFALEWATELGEIEWDACLSRQQAGGESPRARRR